MAADGASRAHPRASTVRALFRACDALHRRRFQRTRNPRFAGTQKRRVAPSQKGCAESLRRDQLLNCPTLLCRAKPVLRPAGGGFCVREARGGAEGAEEWSFPSVRPWSRTDGEDHSGIALAIRPEADRLSWPRVAPPRLVARRSPGRNSGHQLHLLSDIGEEVGEVALDALADLVDVVP